MADLPAAIAIALGNLFAAVSELVRTRPPDAAERLQRATLAITSRQATAEAARTALRNRPK